MIKLFSILLIVVSNGLVVAQISTDSTNVSKDSVSFDLKSSVYKNQYLTEINSKFYWNTASEEILFEGDYFNIDLTKLKYCVEQSDLEDKELIIRVIDMNVKNNCSTDRNGAIRRNLVFSHLIINYDYLTKLFIDGKLAP